jgi:diguanylate cyclase (GGDEF)-like protein/PAS domain S-box-containing protein
MAALERPDFAGDERLARLRAYRILDTPPEPAFDDLVRRAQEAVRAPMAWLSFFDGEREWIKAKAGVALAYLSREHSLAFAKGEPSAPLLIEDVVKSEIRNHPLLAGELGARFFCAVPLVSPAGGVLGTLTVLDRIPRTLGAQERTALDNLAALAVARLETRLQAAPAAVAAVRSVRPDASDAEARIEHLAREYQRLNELLEEEIGLRRGAEERLRREKEFSDAVIESLPGAFYLVGPSGEILRWNASLAAATGHAASEIAGMRPQEFITPKDRASVESAIREVLEEGKEISIEAEVADRAGNVRPYAFSGRPLRIGDRAYMIGVGRDITMRRRAEQQMARAKERLDLALMSSSLALWDWDLKANRVYFNESWSSLLGDTPREATFPGEEVFAWNHPDDRAVFAAALGNTIKGVSEEFDCEYRVPNAAGEWIWVHSRGKVTLRDPARQALRMTGTTTNVTKRKAAEERAEYLATRDALTGLPNRVLLHDRLEQGIVNAARNNAGFAFMFIDLDRFKTINDSLGHQVGDELLKRVASRLTACVRASDTVARLGGDEFAVILENLRDDDDEGSQAVAEKMIAAMGAPMLINNQHLNTSCSIGISLYPADGKDSATLMKHADVAMYYAKDKGRNNYQFFSGEMNARAQERLSIENYLRLALRRNELVLHYQPRMNAASGELVGVEALIRWQHPRRGLLGPDKFIDVAEDSGLIVPIGEWVLEQSCAQIRQWHERVKPGLRLSVNLSVGQVVDGERLYRAVDAAVRGAEISPATLELELTESLLMQNISEKAALLNRLGELGVGLAIDDFGTGYSSLSYLKTLPVDSIKIDSSFVRDLHSDPDDEAIIKAILAMAHSLRLSVVAEGVETEAQYRALRDLGCDEYQGYYASPALTAADFERRYGKQSGSG